jgi:hypothetical protein
MCINTFKLQQINNYPNGQLERPFLYFSPRPQREATQFVSSRCFPSTAAAIYNISIKGSLSRPCHHSSGKRQVDPEAVRKANY